MILWKEEGLRENAAADPIILTRIVGLPTVEGDSFAHLWK